MSGCVIECQERFLRLWHIEDDQVSQQHGGDWEEAQVENARQVNGLWDAAGPGARSRRNRVHDSPLRVR
jgi:hypothetical protein